MSIKPCSCRHHPSPEISLPTETLCSWPLLPQPFVDTRLSASCHSVVLWGVVNIFLWLLDFFFFFETGTLRYSGWPGAHDTDQADLRSAAILLLLPLVCQDCRYATHLFSVWIWPSQGPQTSSHRAAVFYVRLASSYTRSSQFTYVSASVKVSLLISKDD